MLSDQVPSETYRLTPPHASVSFAADRNSGMFAFNEQAL